MSTELEYGQADLGVTFTEFAGGSERGVCVQVTMRNGNYVALTEEQAMNVARMLERWVYLRRGQKMRCVKCGLSAPSATRTRVNTLPAEPLPPVALPPLVYCPRCDKPQEEHEVEASCCLYGCGLELENTEP